MKNKYYYILTGLLALLLTPTLAIAAKHSKPTIGKIASKLSFGAGIMTNIMWTACIVVGIVLIAAAFSQYQIHRSSPKTVPLPVPFTYLILGLIAVSLPFISDITGIKKKSIKEVIVDPSEVNKRKSDYSDYYFDIDGP